MLLGVIAASLLAPLGLLMGMPFPLGLALARESGAMPWIPWFWAVNGSASVLSSVLAVVLATTLGFSAALGAGLAAYGLAMVAQAASAGGAGLKVNE